MTAPTILQLLAGQAERAHPPIPEAIVARLREAGEIYAAHLDGAVRPAVGSLVTPRRDAPLGGAGRPHLVVERLGGLVPPHPKHGLRLDLRVLMLHEQDNDTIASVWVESWWMEPWTEAHAAMSRPPEGSA